MSTKISNVILFFENRLVKACNDRLYLEIIDRRISRRSLASPLSEEGRRPISVFSTLENYNQGRSDSCSPSELDPASHIKYQVPSNCSATDKGFDRFAYRPHQSFTESSQHLASIASFLRKVTTSLS